MRPVALIFAAALLATHAGAQVVPPTEDEARDLWCKQNPEAPECAPPPGGMPQPPCWPANIGGTGTIIYSGNTDTGSWHYWYCRNATAWQGVGLVLPRDRMLIHPRGRSGASAAQTAAAYWALNAFKPADPADKATESAMLARVTHYLPYAAPPLPFDAPGVNDPPPPPPPDVPPPDVPLPLPPPLVAKNGTFPTRPAYPVQPDGTVGSKEAGRATVGEPCDCQRARIVNATSIYCGAPPPATGLVTLCRLP